MSLNQPNHLVPVPSNPLQIPAAPTVASTSATDAGESPIYFSLIIPTYNECKNVKIIVEKLSQLLDGTIPGDYELIVVDDDSPDRTWEVALSLTPDYPQLRVMRREHERGLSTAVIRGWQVARGEVLGVIDADLQHPPETLLQLLAEIKRGADLAAASRHVAEGGVSDWSVVRRFLSRGAQIVGLIILPGVVGRGSGPTGGGFFLGRRGVSCQKKKPTHRPAGQPQPQQMPQILNILFPGNFTLPFFNQLLQSSVCRLCRALQSKFCNRSDSSFCQQYNCGVP